MVRKIGGIVFLISTLMACEGMPEQAEKERTAETEAAKTLAKEKTERIEFSIEKEGLKLYTASSTVEYPTAKLALKNPKNRINESGPVVFDFEVLDYDLQKQTGGEKSELLANSDRGQHIHFILNNAPYEAKYDPSFEADLLEGNNVVLAFLSKSFHESVKTKTAFFFDNFYLGEGESFFDKAAPHLFYSRPKGEYKKSKAQKLLVDFYLVNTTLSEEGNKVKLMVDGVSFMLPHWSAYFIEGLTVGKHEIRIQLVDNKGEFIDGPFNDSGVRTIEIVED